jgi:hypothetical protein
MLVRSATYAILTFLSCFLEIGVLLDAVIRRSSPLWELSLLLLAFHGANLLTYLLTVPRTARVLALGLGLAFLAIPTCWAGFQACPTMAATGVFLAKSGIQWLRNDLKAQAQLGELYKVIPRLAGFSLAFLYSPMVFAVLGVIGLGACLLGSSGAARGTQHAVRNTRQGSWRVYLAMAAHSAHYFAFGYGTPILFAGRYGVPVVYLGLIYTAGWLGYYLVDRLLPPSPRYLVWGHLLSALAILVLVFSPTPWPALLAWTITGFGGGTVFMIPRLRVSNPYDPAVMDLWDNGANIFGLLVFLAALGRGMPEAGFLAAAFLSVLSAWAAVGLRDGASALRTA